MRVWVSRRDEPAGGGANSFARNMRRWLSAQGHVVVEDLRDAERAIVIANHGELEVLNEARKRGTYVVHRVDELFEAHESDYRRRKHEQIRALSQVADVIVFQSQFVFGNAYAYLRPRRWAVILNGSDPELFAPAAEAGELIGHVTWSRDPRKGLRRLREIIVGMPRGRFLLVGNHADSGVDFELPNVELVGPVPGNDLGRHYRRMKLLIFPSRDEPCPNIPIEAILCGVPVVYHPSGGTPEVVRDCGEPLERLDRVMGALESYRTRCLARQDLHFRTVGPRYLTV